MNRYVFFLLFRRDELPSLVRIAPLLARLITRDKLPSSVFLFASLLRRDIWLVRDFCVVGLTFNKSHG